MLMYVPEKLKLNRFKEVAIPKASDMFARFGYMSPTPGQFTGDDEIVDSGSRKTDMLADMDAYDRMMQREELSRSSSPADQAE